jgi:hypothetical protein
MRRLTAVVLGSLVLAYFLPSVSVMAQSTRKPTTQAKAPVKALVKAKTAAKAEWTPTTTPAGNATPAAETDVSTQPTPLEALPAAETAAPDGLRAAQAITSEPAPPPKVLDESEELLAIDRAFAESLIANGPLKSYEARMSSEGILHDASGSSPAGAAGAQTRFGTFRRT